jgi:hypothetical protein
MILLVARDHKNHGASNHNTLHRVPDIHRDSGKHANLGDEMLQDQKLLRRR